MSIEKTIERDYSSVQKATNSEVLSILTIPSSRVWSKNVVDHHAFRFIHEIGPLFAVNMRDNVIMNISIRGGFLSDTERK